MTQLEGVQHRLHSLTHPFRLVRVILYGILDFLSWLSNCQRMKSLHFMLMLVMAAFLSGCFSVSARYSYDSKTDFSDLNSYAWASVEEKIFSTPESSEHYHSVMDDMLTAKGFNLNPESPDFLIVTPRVETYKEGYKTLTGPVDFPKAMIRISFIDPSSKLPIYEGAAVAYIDENATQKTKNSTIDQAVEALLEDFPPGDK
jgi:hypothetical protein